MAETLEITVSDDGLQAVIKEITPKTLVDEILSALKEAGVTHGISGESIQAAVTKSQKSNHTIGEIVVAQGTPAKPALPPHIEPPDDGSILRSLASIVKVLDLKTAADIIEMVDRLKARSVIPGDALGILVVDEGEPGTSVLGQAIDVESRTGAGKSPEDPGLGVTKSSAEFQAATYGYAGTIDGQVSVLPPFWITEDGLTAAFVSLTLEEGSRVPSQSDLEDSLQTAEITWGVDTEGLGKLVEALDNQTKIKPLITVAKGEHPTEPQDAEPEISFPFLSQSGLVREDGSINLRERNSFPNVSAGDTLVQAAAGIRGKEGHTVRGETIEVRLPVETELVAGENVTLEGDSPTQRLIAESDGGATCQVSEISGDTGKKIQYTVTVRPVAQISGNVDYDTGNLDFKGNVEIKGSVLSGFTVKASGDITVGETVESGAQVYGEGNLIVKLGIVGENTLVRTGGDLTAKFVQDATVSAGGNIAVGSYIRSAIVSSQGTVTVEGAGGSVGGILGGEVWAKESVKSKNVGSDHAYTTTISLGIDRESYTEFQNESRLASRAQDLRHSLLSSIGISKLEQGEIRKRIQAQPRRKHEILRYVQKANDLAKAEEEHLKIAKDLGSKMKQASSKAHLDVVDTAYSKVTVRIGEAEKTLDTTLKGVRFRLDSKDEIVAGSLSGDGENEDSEG